MTRFLRRQLAASIVTSLALFGVARADVKPTPDAVVEAAFLYNFAKFTDWPALAPDAPLTLCVVDDEGVAAALVETVRNQHVGGHGIDAKAMAGDASARGCNILFLSMPEPRHLAAALEAIKALPILTVSDGKDFSRSGGVIEFFVENGRMRFSINTDTAARLGLHLSSRLLSLAKIVKG